MTEYFEEIEDIRITGKIKHDLKETIVVVICAVAGGCDSREVIEDFARVKLDWYREVMHLRLANENQIVLGQMATDEKSNEITAVPELLETLDISGCVITADAMNCQKQTTSKIVEQNADYVLGLKDDQPILRQDTEDYFFSALQAPKLYPSVSHTRTFEKGHGRIEQREYYLVTDIDWLDQNSAENMAIVRHIVLNILKIFPTPKKMSVSRKRQKCEYDHAFLAQVLSFAADFHA